MIIGAEQAVGELFDAARRSLPAPREDRPGQPVYVIEEPPEPGETGLRQATLHDLEGLVPACAYAHWEELGIDPLRRDPDGFRWRTRAQIEEGRSWLWEEDGGSASRQRPLRGRRRRRSSSRCGSSPAPAATGSARGHARPGRRLLEQTPRVCLFVRADNAVAIHVYEAIGMHRAGVYRSLIF